MPIAIKAENISKAYQLGEIGTGTLSRDLERWISRVRGREDPFLQIGETNDRSVKGKSDVVWSLKDINFEIEQGDAVGIIGQNGAGKSTLLKILSRVTSPSTGLITGRGRIASLLEVGTGFHPELTGRENIYLNGAILGMRKREIERRFDEIVDFAGIERYIDTPVKRYSSGMYVRLAFAVAAYLESEILIVDEVLAVGDAEFQKKCLGKMGEISAGQGRTVLFVSHNMTSVQNLCKTGILLSKGTVKYGGLINDVINEYQEKIKGKSFWQGVESHSGLKITETKVETLNNEFTIFNNDDIYIYIYIETIDDIKDIVIGFNLISNFGYPVARVVFNDYNDLIGLRVGKYKITFKIPKHSIASGSYRINFDVAIPHIKKINSEKINLYFDVLPRGDYGNKFFVEGSPDYNSIVRSNWFSNIENI